MQCGGDIIQVTQLGSQHVGRHLTIHHSGGFLVVGPREGGVEKGDLLPLENDLPLENGLRE